MTIINSIEIVWELKGIEGYGFGKDKNLYNLKTGRRKKHTMVNYTKGWWIGKSFFTHEKIKSILIRPVKFNSPF